MSQPVLEIRTTPTFSKNLRSKAKIVLNRGGTRSGKTYALCQLAATWLLDGRNAPGVWSIVRSTLPALKATAYRDFIEIIEATKWPVQWSHTNFTFSWDGRMVEFFALDDPQKIRSRKRDFLHLCEANEIDYESFIQLVIRTKRKVFLDFNPDDPNGWIPVEIEGKRMAEKGDVELIKSTYMDNPFLSKAEREEIEYLKRVDPELWAVFGTGEYGAITGTVYPQPLVIDHFPKDLEIIYIGIDWGYSLDPTAMVMVGRNGDNLYVDELLYERGLVNSEIIERVPKGFLCVADSAEPKSIEDFRRAGVRIIPSVKGPDSIRAGVTRVREFQINVTRRSTNLLKEFRSYKWKDNEPIDYMNHGLDALRYVVQTKMKRNHEVGGAMIVNGFARSV